MPSLTLRPVLINKSFSILKPPWSYENHKVPMAHMKPLPVSCQVFLSPRPRFLELHQIINIPYFVRRENRLSSVTYSKFPSTWRTECISTTPLISALIRFRRKYAPLLRVRLLTHAANRPPLPSEDLGSLVTPLLEHK